VLPKINLNIITEENGYRYAIVSRKWLWWDKVLYRIPVDIEFWPREMRIPLPKGVRFPKSPQPTEQDVNLVQDMVTHPGYKTIRKFWNWQSMALIHNCGFSDTGTEKAQGLYQGFLRSRSIIEELVNWGSKDAIESETEGAIYDHMRKMDQQSVDSFWGPS
jgi:hypothetical protein